jgi:thiol-disulfide isomerase/thioredoxin
MWLVLGVLVVVGAALIVATVSQRDSGGESKPSLAPASLVHTVTSVPDSVANQIGSGGVTPPVAFHAAEASTGGKPVMTYMGAEYCPYCAGERWAMVLALSRFGEFHDLGTSHSASEDIHPDTPTFTFHGSTYTSPYLEFDPVEMQTNELSGSTYGTLETPTPAQQKLMATYDRAPYFSSNGAIPFIDFGGKYGLSGASYDVSVLDGRSADDIAKALHDPDSPIAKGIVGTANTMTAAICAMTGDQPASACSIPAVKEIRANLP